MSNAPGIASADHERPTLRSIARLLDTTATTVSRALRNDPKISAEMRERVQHAAQAVGYRPDPEMAKLMHHLRSRRKPRFQGALAAITTRPADDSEAYLNAIVEGARRSANALGHTFELFHVSESRAPRHSLERVLTNRGIEGVLLLPMIRPIDLQDLFDWRRFAVVAATRSVLLPELHRVTPDHFANTRRLCARLAEQGHRRIGLVLRPEQDVRVDHAFTAAVTWHNTFNAGVSFSPFFFDDLEDLRTQRLTSWLALTRPDAIIVTDEYKCDLLAHVLETSGLAGIELASTNITTDSAWPGIDERPTQIGAAAVELLASMIQRGTRGVPPHPVTTMIEGDWHPGRRVVG